MTNPANDSTSTPAAELSLNQLVSPGRTGLVLSEPVIFERSKAGRKGFDLPKLNVSRKRPSSGGRAKLAELPEVSELDTVRHFTRLSTWNYSVDSGIFPLGSCTMKYNPRLNEEMAALPGFSDLHPDTPTELCQGALEVIFRLEKLLSEIAGLDDCSVQPAAGAHGEFTGLLVIRAFHEKHNSQRQYVLVPDTAHGTNPASTVLVGYKTLTVPSSTNGVVTTQSISDLITKHGRDIAALMLTNPNTLGIFESNITEIAELLHDVGAQVYMDGANMNALLGVAKPADMGVDVMQFNLHKTFSTPHGGGGPGSGPVAVRSHLVPFLPNPRVKQRETAFVLENNPDSIGKVKGAFGNFGVLVRALSYILHHGSEGLQRVSHVAVLNANYFRKRLEKKYHIPFPYPSFHECVFNDQNQIAQANVKTLQIAKALIDKGFHPPTIYFPLVVSGAMLIEPTETESLDEIDAMADAFLEIAEVARTKITEVFEHAPQKTIVGRVDEVTAARSPVLTLDDRT